MNFIIIVLIFHTCLAFDVPRDSCHSDLKIDETHYNVTETYHIGDAHPTDAHYDVFGNLFYVESGRSKEGLFFFNIHVIKFKTTTSEKIKGLPEGLSYSIAVDKKDTKVYFGTAKGIYTYSYETHKASPISRNDFKLDMIFVDKNSNKYITEHNNGVEELYRLDGNNKTRFHVPETLNELAIDDNNNFYYIARQKLCVLEEAQSTPVCIGSVDYNGMAQISIHDGKVFVASINLTYFNVNKTDDLKKADKLPGEVTAIAFDDEGHFVLGVRGKILKYKNNECHLRQNKESTTEHEKKIHN